MALNQRERKIAFVLGTIGALVVAYYAGGALKRPFVEPREAVAAKQDKLRTARKELAAAREDLAEYVKLCSRIPEAPAGSAKLDDVERTRHHLRSEIDRLLELPGMKQLDIEKFDKIKDSTFKPKNKKLKRRGPQYTVLTYSLRGRGDLPSAMRLLLEIYRLEDLIYVTQLRVDPVKVKGAKKVKEVDIDIKLQALVVERDPELLEEAEKLRSRSKKSRLVKSAHADAGGADEQPPAVDDAVAGTVPAQAADTDIGKPGPAAAGTNKTNKPAGRAPQVATPGKGQPAKPGGPPVQPVVSEGDQSPDTTTRPGKPAGQSPQSTEKAAAPVKPREQDKPGTPSPVKPVPAETEDDDAEQAVRPTRLAMAEFKYNELVQWAAFDQYVQQVVQAPPKDPKPKPKDTKPKPKPKDSKPKPKPADREPKDTGPPPPDLNWIVKGFVSGVFQEVLIVRGEQQPASTTRRGGRTNQRLGSSSRAGRSGNRNKAPAQPEGPSSRYVRLGEEFGDGVLVKVHRLGVVVSKKDNELWFIRYGESMTDAQLLSTSGYREVQLALEMDPPRSPAHDLEASSESGDDVPADHAGEAPNQDPDPAAHPPDEDDTETSEPDAPRSQPAGKTGKTPRRSGRTKRSRGK